MFLVIEMSLRLTLLRGLVASNFLALPNRLVDFFAFMTCPFFLKPGGMWFYTPTFSQPQATAYGSLLAHRDHARGDGGAGYGEDGAEERDQAECEDEGVGYGGLDG